MKRQELVQYLNQELNIHQFRDYCPNGLQVEGSNTVNKVVTGVTACQQLIEQAIELKADTLLVHHGYFWKGENETITGIKKNRIKALLEHDINLLAYHLPLDCHPVFGNNVQLAKLLDIEITAPIDPADSKTPGNIGKLKQAMTANQFSEHVAKVLQRTPQHIGNGDEIIETIAWCTGGAQGYMQFAIDQGIDAYLTGEINEPVVHNARESGCHYFAAGHHATERYGAKALGEHLMEKFQLEVTFVDVDNPV